MKSYDELLKKVKKHDKVPYEDIILVECTIKESTDDFTPNKLYKKYFLKEMDKKIFDSIINYFISTGRILIERDNGFIVWVWDPVGIEEIEKIGVKIYEKGSRKRRKNTNKSYI